MKVNPTNIGLLHVIESDSIINNMCHQSIVCHPPRTYLCLGHVMMPQHTEKTSSVLHVYVNISKF